MALDLGTNCGWAVVNTDGQRLASGTWRLGKHPTGAERWRAFANHLGELLSDTAARHGTPIACAYEKVRRHAGTGAAHVYGALQAVAQLSAYEHSIPVLPIEVSTWKKIATGNGSASKAHYVRAMNRRFRLKMDVSKREDEAAALGVAVAALKMREERMR